MNTSEIKELVSKSDLGQITSIALIQELWSGYGSLSRVETNKGSYIFKLINLKKVQGHPRGWNSDFSHNRKIKSYEVERNWYKLFNDNLRDAYSPRLVKEGHLDDLQFLILEDLHEEGFIPLGEINKAQVSLVLKWLATFHANNLQTMTNGLWEIGTYWHLKTRPHELEVLDDLDLKKAAAAIDNKLNSAKYKTIVHGDAKLANFLFKEEQSCAAVDFQYIGGGVGIKDVAYFLSSIYTDKELEDKEEESLNLYFSHLELALNDHKDTKNIIKEWRELYPFAWSDFVRFLKGWSPGHYKINSYSQKITKKVLECI
jgi:thiamine kinase-like enzyme